MHSTPPHQTAGGSASHGQTDGEFASRGQSSGGSASGGRLLLIEDDPESAFFFTYVLSKRGGFDVAISVRERETKTGVSDNVIGKAAVKLIACEARAIAKIFFAA